MNTNDMIMNDVETTKLDIDNMTLSPTNESQNIAPTVITPQQINPQQINPQQFNFRKTRTIIHQYNKKIGRNDLCPCGSGKKFKHCCMNNDNNFNSCREITAEESAKVRNYSSNLNNFKRSL